MISRNIDVKGIAGKDPEGNAQYFIGTWRKKDHCSVVRESLEKLIPTAGWETNLLVMNFISDELRFARC